VIVGEDLGTVPPEVRQSMEEKGVLRMFVGQFEIDPWNGTGVHNPAGQMVASVNTHDTPTFAGFARGLDIMDRVELGILKEEGVPAEFEGRNRILQVLADTLGISFPGIGPEWDGILPEVLKRWLLKLAASRARYLILNLEDLWLDENPQNVPGTTCQKPNWKRKMRASFEEFSRDSLIGELLGEIDRVRNGGG